MSHALVIARNWRGRPLKRALIEVSNGLAYIADPRRVDAIRSGESEPVGFPIEDVFNYEAEAFSALEAGWNAEGVYAHEAWQGLARIRIPNAES